MCILYSFCSVLCSDEARPQAKSSKSNDSSNLVVSIPRSKQPRKKESTPIIKTMRMTVSIPRAKLPTQHQQVPDLYQHPLPVGGTDGRGFVIGMDQVAPSFEKVTSEVHSHKKKKKRVHYKGGRVKHVSTTIVHVAPFINVDKTPYYSPWFSAKK